MEVITPENEQPSRIVVNKLLLYLLDFDFLLFVFTKFYSYACYAR